MLFVRSDGEQFGKGGLSIKPNLPIVSTKGNSSLLSLDSWIRDMAELGYYSHVSVTGKPSWSRGCVDVLRSIYRKGARMLVSAKALTRAKLKGRGKLTEAMKRSIKEDWRVGDWHLLVIGEPGDSKFDFREFLRNAGPELNHLTIVSEIYLSATNSPPESPFASKWLQILKCSEIPYHQKTRREKLKHVYDELAVYVQKHEAAKKCKRSVKCRGGWHGT